MWPPDSSHSVLSAPAYVSSLENAVVTTKAKRERGGEKGWTEYRFEEQDILATNICQACTMCQAPPWALVIQQGAKSLFPAPMELYSLME